MKRVAFAAIRGIGHLIYHVGLAGWWIRRRPLVPRVLLYHACQPSEDDFIRGLVSNVQPAHFGAQLAFLVRHYSVVPEAMIASGQMPAGAISITFDDGYRSVLTGAAPHLRAHGLPSTAYLVTRVVGNDSMVWVNELNWLLRQHPEASRPAVVEALGAPEHATAAELVARAVAQLHPRRIEVLLATLRAALGMVATDLAERAALYLSWDEVRELQREGMAFGNHTASHPNLALLDDAECDAEVAGAHAKVLAELGSCHSFAHPFGSVSPRARERCVALGYDTVMEVGSSGLGVHRSRVPRVAAPDAGPAALFAELEFLHPLKEWVRRRGSRQRAVNTRA